MITFKEYLNLTEEELDEMRGASMSFKDVHKELSKDGWEEHRKNDGHTIYKHPAKSGHVSVPRHKELHAPLVLKIRKQAGLR